MDQLTSTVREISGRDLRYVLAIVLLDERRAMTIDQLVEALHRLGLAARGRASKTIADALRWEIGRRRVQRLDRGVYRTGTIPRSTQWWLRQRANAIREGRSSLDLYEAEEDARLRREQRSDQFRRASAMPMPNVMVTRTDIAAARRGLSTGAPGRHTCRPAAGAPACAAART